MQLKVFSEINNVVTQTTRPPRMTPHGFSFLAGLACFFWAFFAWLSVTPNQDILADAVQVQSLFADPGINEDVLAAPKKRLSVTKIPAMNSISASMRANPTLRLTPLFPKSNMK